MFDDARDQLGEALERRDRALRRSEAKDEVDVGSLLFDQVLETHATIEEYDGTRWIVSVGDGRYEIPDRDSDESSESGDSGGESTTEPTASPTTRPESTPTRGQSEPTHGPSEFYEVNGIRLTVDPDEKLAGEPTDEEYRGLCVLTDDHPEVKEQRVRYRPQPVTTGAPRDDDSTGRNTTALVCRGLETNRPVLCEGEAGTGKNSCILSIAEETNHPTKRMSLGDDTSVYDLVGERDVVGGTTYYILGDLAEAAMFGHWFIGDEINMMEGGKTAFVHAITEEIGKRELELRGTGVTLTDLPEGVEWNPDEHLGEYIHPEFRFLATANPLDYSDTKPMNDAFRSRFVFVPFGYLPPEREAELLADETWVDKEVGKELAEIAQILRQSKTQGHAINTAITHREIKQAIEMAGPDESFMSLREAVEIIWAGQMSLPQEREYVLDTLVDEWPAGGLT